MDYVAAPPTIVKPDFDLERAVSAVLESPLYEDVALLRDPDILAAMTDRANYPMHLPPEEIVKTIQAYADTIRIGQKRGEGDIKGIVLRLFEAFAPVAQAAKFTDLIGATMENYYRRQRRLVA